MFKSYSILHGKEADSFTFVFLAAKVVVELAKSELIQAAVLLHPSFVTLDDIKGMHSSA
jgi:hypothetical protein